MPKFEKEIKILNIDVEEIKKKLEHIGAEYIGKKEQKIFTYDIPTIYYRFLECLQLLDTSNDLLTKTTLNKLRNVFDEFSDLVSDEILKRVYMEIESSSFDELLTLNNKEIIDKCNNSKTLLNEISNSLINPNKWIRLRSSNDKIELTVKQVYEKNNSNIQKVKEYEVIVNDLEETNSILEEVGIFKRNYQEKIRYSYRYKGAEIEIDLWPLLNPYIEIECIDENLINEIIHKMNLSNKEIVSLNTEQLYKKIGIDVLNISDLKF